MSDIAKLNLIRFLDFYLMFMFLASTWRRWEQYRELAKLVFAGPARWPKLLQLISEHRMIFWTWRTMAPAGLALLLTVVQWTASRLVWPEVGHPPGELTVSRLGQLWIALPIVLILGVAMVGLDLYFLRRVASIDRVLLEKYFDQAEYWLKSNTAHVVRFFTMGFVNPRKMVSAEVQKALVMASSLLNTTLWWVNLQIALRFSFGLSLWVTWALGRSVFL